MHNASLLDVTANDAVRLNSTRTRNVDNLPVKTRNDSEPSVSKLDASNKMSNQSRVFGEEAQSGILRMRQPAEGTQMLRKCTGS
jgi:hypothetical protein